MPRTGGPPAMGRGRQRRHGRRSDGAMRDGSPGPGDRTTRSGPAAATSAALASCGSTVDLQAARGERAQQRALHAVVDQHRPAAALPVRQRRERARRVATAATWSTASQVGLSRPPRTVAASPSAQPSGRRIGTSDDRAPRAAAAQAPASARGCRRPRCAGMPASTSSSSSDRPAPAGGVTRRVTIERAGVDPVRLELGLMRCGSCRPSGGSGRRSGPHTRDR